MVIVCLLGGDWGMACSGAGGLRREVEYISISGGLYCVFAVPSDQISWHDIHGPCGSLP